jgi:hypothetical protein
VVSESLTGDFIEAEISSITGVDDSSASNLTGGSAAVGTREGNSDARTEAHATTIGISSAI